MTMVGAGSAGLGGGVLSMLYAWRDPPPSTPTSSVPPANGVARSARSASGIVVRCRPLSRSLWLACAEMSSMPADGVIVSWVAPNTAR
jgi:hypothetical protein